MRPQIYIKRETASFEGPRFSGFYGPDNINDSEDLIGEWHAIIYKNSKIVAQYSNSELLDIAGEQSPQGMLLAALVLYLNK